MGTELGFLLAILIGDPFLNRIGTDGDPEGADPSLETPMHRAGSHIHGGSHPESLQLAELQLRRSKQAGDLGSLRSQATTSVRRLMGPLVERSSRCDIEPLQQVVAPDLAPVVEEEKPVDEGLCAGVGQPMLPGFIRKRSSLGVAAWPARRIREALLVNPGAEVSEKADPWVADD